MKAQKTRKHPKLVGVLRALPEVIRYLECVPETLKQGFRDLKTPFTA